MFKKLAVLFGSLLTTLVVVSLLATNAFAYGQCGPGTTNPLTEVHQLQTDRVAGQAEKVEQSAGFHRMDGSFVSFFQQRVVMAPIVKAADPIDYGCSPGTLFSVNHREVPAGTPMFEALPAKYTKQTASTTPIKGREEITVVVHLVAKVNCDNPEQGTVEIHLWILVKVVVHPKPVKHHPKPKHHKKIVKKTKAPATKCSSNGHTTDSGTACQPVTVTTPVTVTPTCTNTPNSTNPCATTVIVTTIIINANCSEIEFSDGSIVYKNAAGDEGSSETAICSSTTSTTTVTTPPAPTPTPTPTPSPTASLTLPTINMVNANNSSDCQPIEVQASSSGDTLVVNPTYATVAQCDSNGNVGAQQDSLSVSIPQGNSTVYVDFFEGNDSDQPSSDSAAVSVTNQGTTLTAPASINWDIQYPTRPS